MTGLRFLFRVTLRRLDLAAEMYHLRAPQKIPLVISTDEAKRLLAVADSFKTRVMLSLGYGCGLRAGEVVRLKVKHIDSAQKIIRVEQSKSRKDRNVMLSPEMLDLLRQWWKVRPSRYDGETPLQERWLFPGSKGRRAGKPITTRHLNRLFHQAAEAAAGLTARGNVPPEAGGRGYLPRPRGGMAFCQCRSRQPRPVEGHDGDRALPHRGARRPCRALRELLTHRNLLQLLPQPALPEVPRGCSKGVAGRARGGAAAGAVLSCCARRCGEPLGLHSPPRRAGPHGCNSLCVELQ